MNNKSLLIVFARNFIRGKVKTRLAQHIGDDAALEVYRLLFEHTYSIAKNLCCRKVLYFSDFIPDEYSATTEFECAVQSGRDLGERMKNAFQRAFEDGVKNVVIIGTDCYELTTERIVEAFATLEHHEAVIGPAKDGGYYLLGLARPCSRVFENKHWSSPTVFNDTIADFHSERLKYYQLPEQSDIDTVADLEASVLMKNLPNAIRRYSGIQ